jgi:hypothetical protein
MSGVHFANGLEPDDDSMYGMEICRVLFIIINEDVMCFG